METRESEPFLTGAEFLTNPDFFEHTFAENIGFTSGDIEISVGPFMKFRLIYKSLDEKGRVTLSIGGALIRIPAAQFNIAKII